MTMETVPQANTKEVLRNSFKNFSVVYRKFTENGFDPEVEKVLQGNFLNHVGSWALTRGYEENDKFFEKISELGAPVVLYFESNKDLQNQDAEKFLDGLYQVAEEKFPQK